LSSSDEQEQETLSFEKTFIQPSQIHKTNEKSKGVASLLKPEQHSAKMERFTSLEVERHTGPISQGRMC
jgi:hypothetical protein